MSEESKEATLRQVDAAMDEDWADECLDRLRKVALRKQWITIDDLWNVIDAPDGDQAKVGAVMRRAGTKSKTRTRFLKPTPYRVFSDRGHHDNVMLWESIIFLSGDETMPEIATLHADPSIDLKAVMRIYEAAKEWHGVECDADLSGELAAVIKEELDTAV